MQAEIAWMFIFDTGGEVDFTRVGEVVHLTPAFEPVQVRFAAPKNVDLPRPLSLRFPPVERTTTEGPRTFEVVARIYAIGAVALTVRCRVEAEDFGRLRELGNLAFVDAAGKEEPIERLAESLFVEVRKGLSDAIVEPYAVAVDPERYAVYAVTDPPMPVENLLHKERRALAALLANEPNPARLAPEEVEDNLRYWYRYYDDDLVIIDWDYGLLVEPTGKYEDTLFVMELANLVLLELRTYDAFLDGVLDRAYDDLSKFYKPGGFLRSARSLQETLSDARIDLIRVTDDLENIGKIFGDWYLAKLYLGLNRRFHVEEWEGTLKEKLAALNQVYTIASHEVEHRRGVFLESLIVLLFVLDILLLFVVAK